MDKKEIQENRMRRYFIDSCKKIIKGEGISGLSVKNVADEAGYSNATLYNYFKDIYALMGVCIDEFIDEVSMFINEEASGITDTRDCVVAKSWAFAKYFIQYPGIYELLFLERLNVIGHNPSISKKIEELNIAHITKDFDKLYALKTIDESNLLKNMFGAMINGYLLVYLNKRIPDDFIEFKARFNASTERFLDITW